MTTPTQRRAVRAKSKGPHHVGSPCRNLRPHPVRVTVSVAHVPADPVTLPLLQRRDTLAQVGVCWPGHFFGGSMEAKCVAISYRIACWHGNVLVLGYAIQHPEIPAWLHLCVRRRDDLGIGWTVDHFESGYQFISYQCSSRSMAIERAIERVKHGGFGHSAATVLRLAGFGWCVPKGVK